MKRRNPQAFTLIEMVTVVAIIIVLAGLIISVAGYVNTKSARETALNQIKNYSLQCDAYKLDNGTVPQNASTDLLDARVNVSPLTATYQDACRYLYACLSGDLEPAGAPDGKPEDGNKVYYGFKRNELYTNKNTDGSIRSVSYIMDPFGNCYGYSTIGMTAEETYRTKLKTDPSSARPGQSQGYNQTTYDLWSTGGATTQSQTGKWIKNWGN